MKRELYEKVFINSEEDLPEEEGYYFVGAEKYDIPFDVYRWLKDKKALKRQWLGNIDWYLRRVPDVTDESDSYKYCIDTQQP